MKAEYQKPTTKFSTAELEALLVEGSIANGGSGGPGVAEGKSFFFDDDEDAGITPNVWGE